MDEIYGGYISKIIFKNKQIIDLNKDDIIVFVGSNNVGKTQCLRDVYMLCRDNNDNAILIKDITIEKENNNIIPMLEKTSRVEKFGNYKEYSGLNYQVYSNSYYVENFLKTLDFQETTDIFISYLDTEERLSICKPPNSINRNDKKTHPIHYIEGELREKINTYFKMAFNEDLIPFRLNGKTIPLVMGKEVKLEESYKNEEERQEKYADILEKYPQIHNQGDGIKSFTGILINLALPQYRVFLLDEPESFLHPPQAKIMGKLIGELLNDNQQAFISTHSKDILLGLLESCPKRVKIIKIDRDDNRNYFNIIDQEEIKLITQDTLLSHSNIINGMFYKNVILCESDSDCQMYSIVNAHLKEKEGKFSETLFLHCGGKDRMSKIMKILNKLKISYKVIVDIDIIWSDALINMISECKEKFEIKKYQDKIDIIKNNIDNKKVTKYNLKTNLLSTLGTIDSDILTSSDFRKLNKVLKKPSKYEDIKENGKNSIPKGDATRAFQELSDMLRDINIIVCDGELESYIPTIGNHGPVWVNKVLDKYPNLNCSEYNKIKEFVSSWNI